MCSHIIVWVYFDDDIYIYIHLFTYQFNPINFYIFYTYMADFRKQYYQLTFHLHVFCDILCFWYFCTLYIVSNNQQYRKQSCSVQTGRHLNGMSPFKGNNGHWKVVYLNISTTNWLYDIYSYEIVQQTAKNTSPIIKFIIINIPHFRGISWNIMELHLVEKKK